MVPRPRPHGHDHSIRTLAPLPWIADEDLLYDAVSRTLHRPACSHPRDAALATRVAAGSALQLIWAPTICTCGPDVTLSLS